MRDARQVEALFGEFEPVEPGVVQLVRWRPDQAGNDPTENLTYGLAAVGRKI